MPALIAPSPITATTLCFCPTDRAPPQTQARPRSRSTNARLRRCRIRFRARLVKPDSPPPWRSVFMRARRPVRILWRIGLMTDVPDQLVAGRVEDPVHATLSSTTPKAGPQMATRHRHRRRWFPGAARPRSCFSCRAKASANRPDRRSCPAMAFWMNWSRELSEIAANFRRCGPRQNGPLRAKDRPSRRTNQDEQPPGPPVLLPARGHVRAQTPTAPSPCHALLLVDFLAGLGACLRDRVRSSAI